MFSSRIPIVRIALAFSAFCFTAVTETSAFVGVNVIPMNRTGRTR